jgi:hypothetical protein
VPVDRWELLAWMADREDNEPGRPTVTGTDLMQMAAGFAGDDGLAWDAVARAAAYLQRAGYIEWLYEPWSNNPTDPRAEFIDSSLFQRMREIGVTAEGRAQVARRRAQTGGTQVNIVNSTVGQVALGNIQNINLFVLLDAMEQSLMTVEASPQEKEDARSAIQRMREAGQTVATSAVGSVLGAALRHALGLP